MLFDAAPDDRPAIQTFLDRERGEYGGTKWFARVEQALADDDLARAWRLSAAASARTVARAGVGSLTPDQRAIVRGMAFASVAGRTRQLNQFQTIVDPSISTSGTPGKIPGVAQGKGIRVGPGGIRQPPEPTRKLPGRLTDATLARKFVQEALRRTDATGIVLGRENPFSEARLFSQIAERIMMGKGSRQLQRETGLSAVELAGYIKQTVTNSARILADFSAWRASNLDAIKVVDSIMLKGGVDGLDDFLRVGGTRGGRPQAVRINRGFATNETLDILQQEGWSLEKLQALMNIAKPAPVVGKLAAITGFSRAFMIAQPVTAWRNFVTQTGRYGVGMTTQALAGAFDTVTGNPLGKGKMMFAQELFRGPRRVGSQMVKLLANNQYRPWEDTSQAMFDFNLSILERATDPNDFRRALAVMENIPGESANFMGYAAGEAQRSSGVAVNTGSKLIDTMLGSQKFRNYLTVFNRAQEFPSRAMIFDAHFRARLREQGFDPNELLTPSFNSDGVISVPVMQKLEQALGPEQLQGIVSGGMLTALDWTFAGQALSDSVPGVMLKMLNANEATRIFRDLAFPFPRFNLVSASRFVYEHSPAGLAEFIRRPYAIFPDQGGVNRFLSKGRLQRGKRAIIAERENLPEIVGKSQQAEVELVQQLTRRAEISRELSVRRRMLKRAERKSFKGGDLIDPGILESAQAKVNSLERTLLESDGRVGEGQETVRLLMQQEKNLKETIRNAKTIGAPTTGGDVLARALTGTAGLAALMAMRSSEFAEDTEWFQLRLPTPFGNTALFDMRPFAPIASPGLLVADVMVELHDNTDWQAVRRQMGVSDELGLVMSPLDTSKAIWDNYEGRLNANELGIEFAEAFLSFSRASGTTLSLVELSEGYGLSPELVTQALIGSIGQFMARFTLPFRPLRDVAGQFSENEAIVRIAPDSRQTFEIPLPGGRSKEISLVGPLLAPLQNIPGMSQVLPERISPFTGEARKSIQPGFAQLTGVRQVQENELSREFTRIGMPGRSMYLERSGSVEVDNLANQFYFGLLNEIVPEVVNDPIYQELGTPALKRDLWQQRILPRLKRATRGQLIEALGLTRVEEVTMSDQEKRARMRWMRAIERMEELQPDVPAEDPDDPLNLPEPGQETVELGAAPPRPGAP